MTRLAFAFARGPAIVTFITGGGPTAPIVVTLNGRGDKDIFAVAEHLGVTL